MAIKIIGDSTATEAETTTTQSLVISKVGSYYDTPPGAPLLKGAGARSLRRGGFSMSGLVSVINANTGANHATLFFNLANPHGSRRVAKVHSIFLQTQHNTALSTPTAPPICFGLAKYSGMFSAAATAVPLANNETTEFTDSVITVRTAVTGANTLTYFPAFFQALPIVSIGTAGWGYSDTGYASWKAEEAGFYAAIRPGMFLVCWQDLAGTTSDVRRMIANVTWTEESTDIV
jgi:hypothetical protein